MIGAALIVFGAILVGFFFGYLVGYTHGKEGIRKQ